MSYCCLVVDIIAVKNNNYNYTVYIKFVMKYESIDEYILWHDVASLILQ